MKAIIVDLDGTLCNSQHVGDFTDVNGVVNWEEWAESTAFATVNNWCADIVHSFANEGYEIIFLTARSGTPRHREITQTWLNNFGFGHLRHKLIMRDIDDRRPDYVIKEEIYNNQIAPFYSTSFAIDDKHVVVGMWRKIGVPALHCADY
jgi:hypothetical protein